MWLAIIVIFVQILVHEYGHYLMAALMKVPVLEFSIGFGPKLFQRKTKSGMLVTLRAFPIGGYCNVKDLDEDTVSDIVPVRKQIPIYLGGAAFNILSCAIIILMSAFILIPKAEVVNLADDSLFVHGTILKGDSTGVLSSAAVDKVEADGVTYTKSKDIKRVFYELNESGTDKYLTVYLSDIWAKQVIEVKQKTSADEKYGVTLHETDLVNRLKYSYSMFSSTVGLQMDAIKMLVNRVLPEDWQLKLSYIDSTENVELQSIVGFAATVNDLQGASSSRRESASLFVLAFITLGISVAVFNLLPIPCLDGGRIIIAIVEGITKRNISTKIKMAFVVGSFAFIIGLSIVVMAKDVVKFVL